MKASVRRLVLVLALSLLVLHVKSEEDSCIVKSNERLKYTGSCGPTSVKLSVSEDKKFGMKFTSTYKGSVSDTVITTLDFGGCDIKPKLVGDSPLLTYLLFVPSSSPITVGFPLTATVTDAGVTFKSESSNPTSYEHQCTTKPSFVAEDGQTTINFTITFEDREKADFLVIDFDEGVSLYEKRDSSGALSKSLLIWIFSGVGALVLILAIIGIVVGVICYRKKKRANNADDVEALKTGKTKTAESAERVTPLKTPKPRKKPSIEQSSNTSTPNKDHTSKDAKASPPKDAKDPTPKNVSTKEVRAPTPKKVSTPKKPKEVKVMPNDQSVKSTKNNKTGMGRPQSNIGRAPSQLGKVANEEAPPKKDNSDGLVDFETFLRQRQEDYEAEVGRLEREKVERERPKREPLEWEAAAAKASANANTNPKAT